MSISILPEKCLDRIFFFLDKRSLDCVFHINHRYKQLIWQRHEYRKIARFILQNYEIIAISERRLWYALKYFQVLGLAETHIEDSHRKLNAHVIHELACKREFSLYTEGNPYQSTQTEFVLEVLRAQAASWDVVMPTNAIKFSQMLGLTKTILILLDLDEVQFKNYFVIALTTVVPEYESKWTAEFERYQNHLQTHSESVAKKILISDLLDCGLDLIQVWMNQTYENVSAWDSLRDAKMIETFFQGDAAKICIAGSDHFSLQHAPLQTLIRRGTCFLAIKPKDCPQKEKYRESVGFDSMEDLLLWIRNLTSNEPTFNKRIYYSYWMCNTALNFLKSLLTRPGRSDRGSVE